MKKKLLWAVITLCLSVLTVSALFCNSGLSLEELWQNIQAASPLWLIPAALCMLGFIFFEGRSLVLILRTLGYPAKKRRGFLYAAADIYFSSITPSATGGQPASAYFMHKDGISGEAVTVSLLLNLTMYTFAIITLGLLSIVCFPGLFMEFNTACRVMILIGVFMMVLLAVFFVLLLKKQRLLLSMANIVVSLMRRIHCRSAAERFRARMDTAIERYNECVVTLAGKKRLLLKSYLLNLLQRASQILVTVFCYYAMHGGLSDGLKVFAIQTYVVLGSNFIPVPGAVGISEFMMYSGYRMFLGEEAAYGLAILGRGISFYTCSIISIFTVLLGYMMIRFKKDDGRKLVIGFYDYTVILTYLSMVSATTGIMLCLNDIGHPYLGMFFLMFCGLCDAFDGKVARTKKDRTERMKKFGVQIDSLSDLVAFGVLPACIGIAMLRSSIEFSSFPDFKFLHHADKSTVIKIILTMIAVLYALAAMIRLAYFNVLEDERQRDENAGVLKTYIGLPVTSSALVFPTILLVHIFSSADLTLLYFVFLAVMGFLFISRIQVKKPATKGVLIMIVLGAVEAAALAFVFTVMRRQ